jgi:hypothetical protein
MSASLKPLKELGEPIEVKFTETVILVVSMHGGYDVIEEGEGTVDIPSFSISSLLKKLKKPVTEPIRSLRTITAAAVGVPFYFKSELMGEYIKQILLESFEYRHWEISQELSPKDQDEERQLQLDNVTKKISESLIQTDKPRIATSELLTRIAIKRKRKSYTEEELTERKNSFIYHNDKMYLTTTYRSDIPRQSEIKDKEFQKIREETEDKYDNKITVLNMPGEPDLLDDEVFPSFKKKRAGRVTIHEILNYLYSQGVNNVILVDFTCSHCDYGRPDARTVRRMRQRVSKRGGRKKKTLKKNISKNKTRNRPKKNYL